jgi:Domain of unknown function (DUF4401)
MNDDLITAMRGRGLVGDASPPARDDDDRPWFVSLLMGIAGWVAGLFVLVFLAISLDLDKRLTIAITGAVLLAVAWALYAMGRGKAFVDQLALALSIAGQLAITVYLIEKLDDALPVTAAILGMQLLLFAVMPDRVAKTLSAFFASIVWVLLVRFWLRPHEGEAFFDAGGDIVRPMAGAWMVPLEWAITWAPPIVLVLWLRHTESRWMARALATYARPAITGLLLGLAIAGLAAEPVSLLTLHDELGRAFNWWSLLPLLSIGLALFAAYNAFALRSAGMTGFAIVAALAHLARFYYLNGTTLTLKATLMLGAGALLLGAGRLLARRTEART